MLTVLELFSGIGGFSLGLERTGGFKTVAGCEIDPFCRQVLAKHWPEVPIHDDIRTLNADWLAEMGAWQSEPDVGRVAYGIPARVDRLKALGNAVVPQIPELIGLAIMEANP